MSEEKKFAGDFNKKEAKAVLDEAGVEYSKMALLKDLRVLLVTYKLAEEEPIPTPTPKKGNVKLKGLQLWKCEMLGEQISFEAGEEFQLDEWKAEKLVKAGVAEYV